MVIDFSNIDVRERPVLVLKTLSGQVIQTLGYAFNLSAKLCFNEISEISFDLPASVEGVPVPNYDKVVGMMLVDMVGYGQFELRNPKIENDGVRKIKHCQAYSLEYAFTRKKFFIEPGTYNFWDPTAPNGTILGYILEDMPDWSIGDIDPSLIGKYRTFDSSGDNIYNFMKSTLQESYNCIFDFDTYNRKINVRDCSSDVSNSPIFLSTENLIKKISIEEDTDSVVTVLDVNGASGVNILGVNPIGENKIYNLDYFMNTINFDQKLIDKWNLWCKEVEDNKLHYYNLSVEQALGTAKYLAENAKLVDLEGELTSLQNIQSAIIQGEKEIDGFEHNESLISVKNKIKDKQDEVDAQEGIVNSTLAENGAIESEMEEIVSRLKIVNYFEQDELIKLLPYFIEDSIEESSFVVSDAKSYDTDGVSNSIASANILFENGTVTKISNTVDKQLYTASGGNLKITYGDNTLSAEVIRASFEIDKDNKLTLSAYLGDGTGYDTSTKADFDFESGTLSMTGIGGDVVDDTQPDVDAPGAYSTGASFRFDGTELRMFFTKSVTEYERRSVEWDLYDYGRDTLNKLAWPSYSFKVDAANFLTLDEFIMFAHELTLGDRVYLQIEDGRPLSPVLIGVSINFERPNSLSLEFGDKYTANDSSFKLVDLLEKSVSMGKKVDFNKYTYSAFIDSGAQSAVHDFMTSALDVAKNKILSSGNQNIVWDESGLHLRKLRVLKDGAIATRSTMYDDKQIRMINNMIAFTNNNWETVNMAIGEVEGPNGDPIYGIAAPSIVGTLLAGENLVIESKNEENNTTLFRVNSSGAMLHNAKFDIISGDNNKHIVLDPEHGFGIGKYPILQEIEEDGVPTKVWADGSNKDGTTLQDNVKFWVDTEGNVHFKGELHGASGDFTGIVNASDLQINGTSILKTIEDETGKEIGKKINSSYLDLGNIVIDGASGNISLTGNINIGGNITWNSSSSPMKVLYARTELTKPTGVYSAFPNTGPNVWHKTLDSSNDYYASYSYDGGSSWTSAVKIQGVDGKDGDDGDDANIPDYIFAKGLDFTEISNSYIQSPVIYGGEFYGNDFNIYPDVTADKYGKLKYSDTGSLNLYGGYGGNKYHFFQLHYFEGDAPWIYFESPDGAYAHWKMGYTVFGSNDSSIVFYGSVDFTKCTNVDGLTATAVFAE